MSNHSDHIVPGSFIQGKLSPEEKKKAEEHLNNCPQCRAAVEGALEVLEQKENLESFSKTLFGFTAHMIQGGVKILAPPIKNLPIKHHPQTKPLSSQIEAFEPLRVLQPRVAKGTKGLFQFLGRFGLVILLTILVLLLPRPSGLSPEGHRALAVFVFTGSILALEPVSLPIAALLVPVAQVVLGVATATLAFNTYSRPVVFLILASLFLAEAIRKYGLTRRIALATIVTSRGEIGILLLGIMGIAAGFSMWVENTATAAVLIPVALTISKQVPDPKKARGVLVLMVLGIAYSASLGGMVTVMGSSSNAVASGFLTEIRVWTFIDWMKFGLPSFLLIFPITWWVLLKLVQVDVRNLDVEPVRKQVKDLGAMTREEYEILYTMLGAVVLWVGGSFIEPALNLPPTLLSAAMVAVIAVGYLSIRNIINWEDVKGVSWGIFLIIGAGLSLGETLNRTGATDWFADIIQPLVKGPPLIISLLLLVFLSALLTNVMNNTTIAAVFVPILISLAKSDPAFNAIQLVLPVTLATTFGYSLPSASGRMALIAASGIVSRGEMMRNGLILTIISSTILGLFFYLLAVIGWV